MRGGARRESGARPASLRWLDSMEGDALSAAVDDAAHAQWMEEALAEAHAQALRHPTDHSVLSRAYFAKEQLQLVQKYQRICAKLERHGAALLTKQVPLVPVHFPVTPLPNTRVSMAEGISRAFVLFCRQLHEATLTVAPERLATIAPSAMAKLVNFVQNVASDLWEETQAVINEETTDVEARGRLVAQIVQFSNECVCEERARLGAARAECDAMACALRDFFGKRALTQRQLKRRGDCCAAKAGVARTWLRGLVRRGHGCALRTLLDRREVSRAVRVWCACSDGADGAVLALRRLDEGFERVRRDTLEDRSVVEGNVWAAGVYDAVSLVGNLLMSQAVAEGDDLRWLEEQDVDERCWCTTVVVEDAPEIAMTGEGALLQAPGHMVVFANGRLRLLAPRPLETTKVKHAELPGVRMVHLLVALLRKGHLPLDRLGSDYANRIVVCEYCKYERAVLSIEAETLAPFGQLVRVPYTSAIPDLATARRAQRQPPLAVAG